MKLYLLYISSVNISMKKIISPERWTFVYHVIPLVQDEGSIISIPGHLYPWSSLSLVISIPGHLYPCSSLSLVILYPWSSLSLVISIPGHLYPWSSLSLVISIPGHLYPWSSLSLVISIPWSSLSLVISIPGHLYPWSSLSLIPVARGLVSFRENRVKNFIPFRVSLSASRPLPYCTFELFPPIWYEIDIVLDSPPMCIMAHTGRFCNCFALPDLKSSSSRCSSNTLMFYNN